VQQDGLFENLLQACMPAPERGPTDYSPRERRAVCQFELKAAKQLPRQTRQSWQTSTYFQLFFSRFRQRSEPNRTARPNRRVAFYVVSLSGSGFACTRLGHTDDGNGG
jgi:hypothetical protein